MTFGSSSLLNLARGIGTSPSLIELDISYTKLSKSGLKLLTDNLPMFGGCNLKKLNLAGNRIGENKELSQFLGKFHKLTDLNLSFNNLSTL